MRRLFICLVLALGLSPASAMDFRLSGKKLVASGVIIPGDATRFARVIADAPKDDTTNTPDVVVSLESSGGNLLEGMRLGWAIRDASVGTLVERGKTCASACAVAYLGGKQAGVSASGILDDSSRAQPSRFTASDLAMRMSK
jgi:hypothetical protein